MTAVRSKEVMDSVERKKLHLHVADLRKDAQRFRKLIELTRPTQIPSLSKLVGTYNLKCHFLAALDLFAGWGSNTCIFFTSFPKPLKHFFVCIHRNILEQDKPKKALPLFGAMKGGNKFKLKTGTIGVGFLSSTFFNCLNTASISFFNIFFKLLFSVFFLVEVATKTSQLACRALQHEISFICWRRSGGRGRRGGLCRQT